MLNKLFCHSITLSLQRDIPNSGSSDPEYPRAGCARLPPRRMLCHLTK
jgi:hypothetical protein